MVISLLMLFPMLWMFFLSFIKYPDSDIKLSNLFNYNFTFDNYIDALNTDSFGLYFFNSIFVGLLVTLFNVFFCYSVAYILARKKFKLNNLILYSIIVILTIPAHVIMIPLYDLIVTFGWINTFMALTIPWLITPLGVFLVYQFLKTIPKEIEEAAKIDGAGDLKIIYGIIMPLARPILSVLFVITLLNNWNSFLFPFLFTNDEAHRTLPVGLAFYLGKQSIDWGHLMAGASISAIPILTIFLIFQKNIISSLTAGALKE